MVWTSTTTATAEIESKRLSYFLKSALAHAFFLHNKGHHIFESFFFWLLLGPPVAFMWPFWRLLFENTGNFLQLKTLAEKCIECDERDWVVTTYIRSMYCTQLAIKSLSVCTWKKLQKPQICAQAVGIMYNTYGNFFVLGKKENTVLLVKQLQDSRLMNCNVKSSFRFGSIQWDQLFCTIPISFSILLNQSLCCNTEKKCWSFLIFWRSNMCERQKIWWLCYYRLSKLQ